MSFIRTILITGSTDGIGKQTATELSRNAENLVIIHGRNEERARQAIADIKRIVPTANLDLVVSDFGSLKTVVTMAKDVQQRFPKLNVLLCNAGVLLPDRTESSDGIEMAFQVNHLAHFLLAHHLVATLKANAPGRVVVVSSICHDWYPMAWDDLESKKEYEKYTQYSRTKLANHLFAFALARRLKGSGVTCNVLEPGVIETKLLRNGGFSGAPLAKGAVAPVFLVQNTSVANVTGTYFDNSGKQTHAGQNSEDEHDQERLWTITEKWLGKLGLM